MTPRPSAKVARCRGLDFRRPRRAQRQVYSQHRVGVFLFQSHGQFSVGTRVNAHGEPTARQLALLNGELDRSLLVACRRA